MNAKEIQLICSIRKAISKLILDNEGTIENQVRAELGIPSSSKVNQEKLILQEEIKRAALLVR